MSESDAKDSQLQDGTNHARPVPPSYLNEKKAEDAALNNQKFNMIAECPVFYPTLDEFNNRSFSDLCMDYA
jgi:hypothetical protein